MSELSKTFNIEPMDGSPDRLLPVPDQVNQLVLKIHDQAARLLRLRQILETKRTRENQVTACDVIKRALEVLDAD